jgi:hypothetical protein
MKNITRRTFIKRTGSPTIAAALGIGVMPSMTTKLRAVDVSQVELPLIRHAVKWKRANVAGGPLTGDPAVDGFTWQALKPAEAAAQKPGAVAGDKEGRLLNWTLPSGYPVESKALLFNYYSAPENQCVDPLIIWQEMKWETSVMFEGDEYKTGGIFKCQLRYWCENGVPKCMLWQTSHTWDNEEVLPPGKLLNANGEALSDSNHLPDEETGEHDHNFMTAGLYRNVDGVGMPTQAERGNGVFQNRFAPNVDTNYTPDSELDQLLIEGFLDPCSISPGNCLQLCQVLTCC